LRLQRAYRSTGEAVYHLQYPSMGIGVSLSPVVLPALSMGKYVVTLHEFSVFNPLRKAAFLSWALLGSAIVFSNEYERERFSALYSFARDRCHVIPIGTNIEGGPAVAGARRDGSVVFFGQLSPGKGVEEYLATARLLRLRKPDLKVVLMGRVMEPKSRFARQVRQACAETGIELLESLPAALVAERLGAASVAVLPFPDGISDKRGSALACLANGLTVVTVHSDKTPAWLRETTYSMRKPGDAVETVCQLLEGERTLNPNFEVLEAGLRERTWDSIAERHRSLYASL